MQCDQIDSSGIIPLSKETGEWKVFLIQYRGYEQFWGCPKSRLEPQKTPIEAATLELEEETGLRIKRLFTTSPFSKSFTGSRKVNVY